MSMSWKKGLATVSSVAMIGVLLAGCGTSNTGNSSSGSSNTASTNGSSGGTSTSDNSKPVEGGSITLDITQAVPDLDPAVAFDTNSAEIEQQVYEPLVTYKGSTDQLTGDLATDWTVSTDGKTYTFHIRNGVKFSNGDPVTAKNFVYQLQRILDKNLQPKPSPGYTFFLNITGAQAYYDGKAKSISGVSTPDDYTLVIKLDKPQQYFIKILAMPFLSATDPSFVNKVGNAAFDTTKSMGTGPFILQSNSQSQVVLVKNPNYWQKDSQGNQLPYLDKVTININNNSQLDALHWEQGKTAFMSPWLMGGDGLPASAYATIMNTPKYKQLVMQQPENSFFYIGLNMKKTLDGKPNPLSNIKVRQAIEYGFDRSQYVKLENGADKPVNEPMPDSIEGFVKNLDPSAQYSFDPNKAKQLLKDAGYANGLTLDMWNRDTETAKKEDQAFQAMMKNIGININLHEVTFKDFLTKAMSGTAPIYFSGWNQDYPDASDFLNTFFNTNQIPENNMSNYSDPQVDQWLNAAEFDASASDRDNLYAKVINKVMSDAVFVPTTETVGHWSVQSWVHGFYTSNITYDPMAYIWVDPGHNS
ncbi:ABC transporter substrate-binding protein [Alicyclobacillus dauci]|uniref:Peptide ABC transporter substrate-binding protein n=1 Tax=Alicyclobacillus dauci TaxID=1475485 RepID=A0ABY6YYM6_9BACL|nr:peptide ABC transporter substrate-binding protein [Alicyclobacillus dauci]WAH35719.1 peptide ABC transporter substrate-binding protein [Alicyclobacillus dauci]